MGRLRIELQNVSKSYYSENGVTQALHRINLEFREGEFVAITGESGSGKSTLLHIIGGMDSFDEGEMFLDGQPTFQYDEADWEEYRRNQIGYVFQDYSLISHYTVLDNIVSALLIMGKERAEAEQTALSYLEKVGLKGYEAHRATELSSGQKQRLSIARALAKGTGIIAADEPTGNLDSETGLQIVELLRDLSKESLVIMVTHNYSQAEPYVTRKVRLHDGMIVSDVRVGHGVERQEQDRTERADAGAESIEGVSESGEKGKEAGTESAEGVSGSGERGKELGAKDIKNVSKYEEGKEPGIESTRNTSGNGEKGEKTGAERTKSVPKSGEKGKEPGESTESTPENKIKARFQAWASRTKKEDALARLFAKLNVRTQKGKGILFTLFLFVISAISFLLIGELYLHRDDITTKAYSRNAFYREEPERLIAKRGDGAAITEQDLETIRGIAGVTMADSCDVANDINFYIEEERDYGFKYGKSIGNVQGEKQLEFKNASHFVMSQDCISEEDLTAGQLPQSRREIALYSEDKSILGSEVICYFTSVRLWGADQYYQEKMVVTGLLKEKTEQVYFSRRLCNMMSAPIYGDSYRLYYVYSEEKQKYRHSQKMLPVINEELTGNQVQIAEKFDFKTPPGPPYPMGETLPFHCRDSESGELCEENAEVQTTTHNSSSQILAVSEEFFDKYNKEESTQASVYIVSYAKTDKVIRRLEKAGYQAISTYRMGVEGYLPELVNERLVIIGICVLGLLLLFVAEVMILKALMKIRIKDYFVLKFIGMELPVIRKMTYHEMGVYGTAAVALTLLTMLVLRCSGIPVIVEMMWYYSFGGYLLFVLYNMALVGLTAASFNRLLKGRLQA